MRLLFLLLLVSNVIFAQSEPAGPEKNPASDSAKVYESFDVEKPPVFPGGEPAMLKFIAQNVQYPALAREKDTQGIVLAEMVIEKDGSPGNMKIVRGVGDGCDEEVLRVLALMPKWEPGEKGDEKVRVRYVIPVRFRLEGGKRKKKKN